MEGGKQYLYPLMALLVALVVCSMIGNVDGAVSVPRYTLTRQYYKKTNTCAHVEAYVKHNVKVFWDQDKSITPKLLRLLYSDCMVTVMSISYLYYLIFFLNSIKFKVGTRSAVLGTIPLWDRAKLCVIRHDLCRAYFLKLELNLGLLYMLCR